METAKEVGKAIKNGESEIVIEGDLSRKIFKLHAKGPVAMAIGIGSIALATKAVTALVVPDPAEPVEFAAAAVSTGCAAAALGSATGTALSIAATGGVASLVALNKKYKIASNKNGKLVLKKK